MIPHILYSFNTGDLHIEYFKIDGEIFLNKVCLDYYPKIRKRLDITKKVIDNYNYMYEVHSYIEDYEDLKRQEYLSEYHNERSDHDQN